MEMKWFILLTAMACSLSEASRGVTCMADGPPPSPITYQQQEVAFRCALNCINAGESACSTSGFAMSWDTPECVAKGAGNPPKSDFTCSVS